MSLKEKLEERGLTLATVEKAIFNTEKVLANVINNASKNTTGAQAMRSNTSNFANDLKVMYDLRDEFVAEAEAQAKADEAAVKAAQRKPKIEKPAAEPEANDVSEADKG